MFNITEDRGFLEGKFKVMKGLIRSLSHSENIHALIVEGSAGIGKSHVASEVLNAEEIEFESIQGHITPLQLYSFLYNNNEKMIVIDDNGTLLKNPSSLSILLNVLWGIDGKRTVCWLSTSEKLKVPERFDFKGKIMLLTNSFPADLENVKSRAFFYLFSMDFSEKVKMMAEMAENRGIDMEIVDWIKENCTEINNIDLRTLAKLDSLKKSSDNWKELAAGILEVDEKKLLVRELLKELPVEKAAQEFVKRANRSRMTFYNIKKKMGL